MRESERRIREYQKVLPHLKEKVSTIAFLFVMSIVMMTASTFAWVTISKSPSAEGITTTVAANGNLEIALSDSDGLEPDESLVGDSGKDLVLKNVTWGNLVNLSDDRYGLEHIILRPAEIDDKNLIDNPLYAVEYGADGRIIKPKNDFSYTNFDAEEEQFVVNKTGVSYGVRAISSVKYTSLGANKLFIESLGQVDDTLTDAQVAYMEIVGNESYMDTLGSVIGKFLNERLNDGRVEDYNADINNLYLMMVEFEKVMDLAGEAYLSLANLQILLKDAATYEQNAYNNLSELLNDTKLSEKGVELVGFEIYKKDAKSLVSHLYGADGKDGSDKTDGMEGLYNEIVVNKSTRKVVYSEISSPISFMVNINTTEVEGIAVGGLGIEDAGPFLRPGDTPLNVVIYDGAIKDMEQRIGAAMKATVSVSVTYGITLNKTGVVTTAADKNNYYIPTAKSAVENKYTGNFTGADKVSEDTFAMAIDLWVRTNMDGSYLMLEGSEEGYEQNKIDADGYSYYMDSDGVVYVEKDDKYYLESDRSKELTLSEEEISEITKNPVKEFVVTGYNGENRVWSTDDLSEYSTTQGIGSCYVFYANTPEDQAKNLELLKAMKVAFISEDGEKLATAEMDTEMSFAENGRVTVPLKLDRTESISLGMDLDGNEQYAITQLEKGEAIRITAIVYLKGANLTNEQVNAASAMQGQLNIQFGSSDMLDPYDDNELKDDVMKLTATANPSSFEDYVIGNKVTTQVTLKIEGQVSPTEVEANFIRAINEQQGSRQESFAFKKGSEAGVWTGNMTFDTPGDYILRTVWLDGIEYQLTSPIEISLPGYTVGNVTWSIGGNDEKVMTADNNYSTNISLSVLGDIDPTTVKCVLSNEYNQQITVDMQTTSQNTQKWSGTANFTTSGTYNLQYVVVDGEYYEIPESDQKTVDLYLGLKADVSLSKNSYTYDPNNEETNKINVELDIFDDKGNAMRYIDIGSDVAIRYNSATSTVSEKGLHAELEWDASKGKYIGTFTVRRPGIYRFAQVEVGSSNVITSGDALDIYAISPIPPSYSGHTASAYALYMENMDRATIKINLADAGGIDPKNVVAVMKNNTTGVTEMVTAEDNVGEQSGSYIYTFTIPNGDGIWQINKLQLAGVFVDEKESTASEPYIIDLSNYSICTEVESMEVTSISDDYTFNPSQFMVEQKVPANELQIKVTNGSDKALKCSPDKITVNYKLASLASGYVDTDGVALMNEVYSVVLNRTSDKMVYEASENSLLALTYAGTYECVGINFTVSVEGTSYKFVTVDDAATTDDILISMGGAMPKFDISWSSPSVKFSSVSPTSIDINQTTRNETAGMRPDKKVAFTNKIYDNDLTCDAYTKVATTWGRITGYSLPKVVMKISDAGGFDSASVIFNRISGMSGVIYEDGATSVEFAFSSSLSPEVEIGGNSWTGRQLLGTATANKATLSKTVTTDLTVSYEFNISELTLNNLY